MNYRRKCLPCAGNATLPPRPRCLLASIVYDWGVGSFYYFLSFHFLGRSLMPLCDRILTSRQQVVVLIPIIRTQGCILKPPSTIYVRSDLGWLSWMSQLNSPNRPSPIPSPTNPDFDHRAASVLCLICRHYVFDKRLSVLIQKSEADFRSGVTVAAGLKRKEGTPHTALSHLP